MLNPTINGLVFSMLHLCDINDYRDAIKAPIDAIGKRSLLPDLYSDIIKAIEAKQAFLFAKGPAFAVVKPIVQHGSKKLLVWAVYGGHNENIKPHLPQIKAVAKDIGAEALQFWTNIPGLQRYYPRLGAKFVRNQDHFQIWEITL